MYCPEHLTIIKYITIVLVITIIITMTREMRCLRHKIHLGLFCAFGLSAFNWILTLSWASLVNILNKRKNK